MDMSCVYKMFGNKSNGSTTGAATEDGIVGDHDHDQSQSVAKVPIPGENTNSHNDELRKKSISEGRLKSMSVGAAVKRAIDVMGSAISTKPAKLARYDNGVKSDEFQPLEDFYREMQTDTTDLSFALRNFRAVIPPDMLKLDERHTPLDVEAFLSRVETYDLLMWPNKPDRISAFQCARYGWRIAGTNTLLCVSCHRVEVVPQDPPSCMTLSDWTSKIELRLKKTGHMTGCIWMKSPSPLNILQLPSGREMQNYLSHTAESYKKMKILPVFSNHYRLVKEQVDLNGLKSKTNMSLTQIVTGANQGMLEDTALFLMINGWTMEGAFENTIKCQLCLRQTPLWLCLSTPSYLSIQDMVSPPCSPRTKAESNIKEFDPIVNHLSWCPWRIQLQSVDRVENVDNFLFEDETNMFSPEGMTVDLHKLPNVQDYIKLAFKIDEDYKTGRLLYGSALQMSNYNAAIETIFNVKELLGSAVRSENKAVRRSEKLTNSICLTNEIMSVKCSKNVSRQLFLDASSTVNTRTKKVCSEEKQEELLNTILYNEDEAEGEINYSQESAEGVTDIESENPGSGIKDTSDGVKNQDNDTDRRGECEIETTTDGNKQLEIEETLVEESRNIEYELEQKNILSAEENMHCVEEDDSEGIVEGQKLNETTSGITVEEEQLKSRVEAELHCNDDPEQSITSKSHDEAVETSLQKLQSEDVCQQNEITASGKDGGSNKTMEELIDYKSNCKNLENDTTESIMPAASVVKPWDVMQVDKVSSFEESISKSNVSNDTDTEKVAEDNEEVSDLSRCTVLESYAIKSMPLECTQSDQISSNECDKAEETLENTKEAVGQEIDSVYKSVTNSEQKKPELTEDNNVAEDSDDEQKEDAVPTSEYEDEEELNDSKVAEESEDEQEEDTVPPSESEDEELNDSSKVAEESDDKQQEDAVPPSESEEEEALNNSKIAEESEDEQEEHTVPPSESEDEEEKNESNVSLVEDDDEHKEVDNVLPSKDSDEEDLMPEGGDEEEEEGKEYEDEEEEGKEYEDEEEEGKEYEDEEEEGKEYEDEEEEGKEYEDDSQSDEETDYPYEEESDDDSPQQFQKAKVNTRETGDESDSSGSDVICLD